MVQAVHRAEAEVEEVELGLVPMEELGEEVK